jgi:hypothetical protein
MKPITRLILTLTILVFLIFVAGATFPAGTGSLAAPAGRTSVDDIWGFAPRTLTITGTQTLTPAVSEYHFNNATALTLTLSISNARPGDRLRIASLVVTDTVILTNNTSLDASATISEDDVLEFEYFGGAWVPVIVVDN